MDDIVVARESSTLFHLKKNPILMSSVLFPKRGCSSKKGSSLSFGKRWEKVRKCGRCEKWDRTRRQPLLRDRDLRVRGLVMASLIALAT